MFGKLEQDFLNYYKELFARWSTLRLVEQENILGQIIDGDMAVDFVLIDEVILLCDMVRDECVKRLACDAGMEI